MKMPMTRLALFNILAWQYSNSNKCDSVCYKILLNKLELYGIKGVLPDLIVLYLSNREQFVSHQEQKLDLERIYYGAP